MNSFGKTTCLAFIATQIAIAACSAQEQTPVVKEQTPVVQSPDSKIKTIDWLLGTWVSKSEKRNVTERWIRVNETLITGASVFSTNVGNRKTTEESLLLAEMSGDVFYLAKPQQNEFPTPFKLVESSSNHAIFENQRHDFPKQLEYRLAEKNRLNVKVSNEERSFVISFEKQE